jgi:hypothetical protein
MSFRVRPELARAIQRTAVDRGISVQAFILLALRNAGVPVLDVDLEDLRQGGTSGSPRKRSFARRSDLRSAMSDVLHRDASATTPDLVGIVDMLAEIVTRDRWAAPNIVINCGCAEPRPAVKKSVKRRKRKKGTDDVIKRN